MKLEEDEYQKIYLILKEYYKSSIVEMMDCFIAHGHVTVLQHANSVVKMSYWINKKYKLNANLNDLLTASLLHDLYLYDWHIYKCQNKGIFNLHGFTHSEKAKENALKYFRVNLNVQNCISSHMWPLNISKIPGSKEAWILTIADKICAIKEILLTKNTI